ncbi:hypothetical protein ACFL20_07765 [Spirochaetota bacterium]
MTTKKSDIMNILRNNPIRASFLSYEGCINQCSICAEGAGKYIEYYPFEIIRDSIENMDYYIEEAALYNSNDGLRYKFRDRYKKFNISHICSLLLNRGTSRVIVSTPGIPKLPENDKVLNEIIKIPVLSSMLSLNRDHLKSKFKLKGFKNVFSYFSKNSPCEIRVVYTSLKERSQLLDLLDRLIANNKKVWQKKYNQFTITTVPAIPIGRAKKIYFPVALKGVKKIEEKRNKIIQLFRDEKDIEELEFITDGTYSYFLKHGAIQFNNMFVLLLRPSVEGMIVELKVVDPVKIEKTGGASFSSIYRYDNNKKRFIRRGNEKYARILKLVIFNINDLKIESFKKYLNKIKFKGNRDKAVRVFEVFMNLRNIHSKCMLNKDKCLIITNGDYRDLYYETIYNLVKRGKNISRGFTLKKSEVPKYGKIIFGFLHQIAISG